MSTPVSESEPGAWLAQMAHAIEEMLWVWDASTGRVVYANPAF